MPYSGKLFNAYITSSLQYLLLKCNTDIQNDEKTHFFSFLFLKVNISKSQNKFKEKEKVTNIELKAISFNANLTSTLLYCLL